MSAGDSVAPPHLAACAAHPAASKPAITSTSTPPLFGKREFRMVGLRLLTEMSRPDPWSI
jgi:hypothetical protein